MILLLSIMVSLGTIPQLAEVLDTPADNQRWLELSGNSEYHCTCKEVRDFPWGQQIIDQHQELLIGDLCISEEEHRPHVLETSLDVELS